MDEDALLQQALALSMQAGEHATPAPSQSAAATPAAPAKGSDQPTPTGGQNIDEAMLEVDDPELALALQMSMAEAQPGEEEGGGPAKDGDGA